MTSKFRIGQKVGSKIDIKCSKGNEIVTIIKRDEIVEIKDIRLSDCCKSKIFILNVGDYGLFNLMCEYCGYVELSEAYFWEEIFYPLQEQNFGELVIEKIKEEIKKETEIFETVF